MRTPHPIALLPRAVALLVFGAAVVAWLLCLVPTGLSVRDLATFAAPGALLWMGLGCAAHAVSRRDVPWQSLVRWALLGAALLPPVLGFLIAVAGADRPQQLLSLFTLGAWFTLALGGMIGVLVALRVPAREGAPSQGYFIRHIGAGSARDHVRRFWQAAIGRARRSHDRKGRTSKVASRPDEPTHDESAG